MFEVNNMVDVRIIVNGGVFVYIKSLKEILYSLNSVFLLFIK